MVGDFPFQNWYLKAKPDHKMSKIEFSVIGWEISNLNILTLQNNCHSTGVCVWAFFFFFFFVGERVFVCLFVFYFVFVCLFSFVLFCFCNVPSLLITNVV